MANANREYSSHLDKTQEQFRVSPREDESPNFQIGFEPIFFLHSIFKAKSIIEGKTVLPEPPR
jgi:hypothetical protein